MVKEAGMKKDGMMKEVGTMKEAGMKKDAKDAMMKKTSMTGDSINGVRLVVRSGCAACEFGVNPIGAPDQLGLAVIGDNGQITVIEGAHQDYPQIYKNRFQGQRLAVAGEVVKTQGKISWLKPSSLALVN